MGPKEKLNTPAQKEKKTSPIPNGSTQSVGLENKNKSSKQERKLQNKAIESTRLRERDEMLSILNENESEVDDDSFVGHESKPQASNFTVDKFGNTISKAKQAEAARLETLRAEARARRAQRGIGTNTIDEASVSDVRVESVAADDKKLTHKAKRLLQLREIDLMESHSQQLEDKYGLSSFSLSIQASMGGDDGEGGCLSATDIIIPSFTLTAPARPLLIDASLRIVSDRKYGLLAPNGR
jgi:hypothetical protein